MRYNKSQLVLEMSTKSFDTSTKTSTPLSYCGIDDALTEFIPRGDDWQTIRIPPLMSKRTIRIPDGGGRGV